MIFYFTGTGNSLYAAKYIARNIHEETLIDIAQAVREKNYFHYVPQDEPVGFVFPVYYGGMPGIVAEFVGNLRLTSEEMPYVWALVNYGGKPFGAVQALQIALEKRDVYLSAAFGVKMPDNYIVMYDPTDPEKAREVLHDAETGLLTATAAVLNRTHEGVSHTITDTVATVGMQVAYRFMRRTAAFHADENCISCGQCAKICPVQAIKMKNGSPVWVKSSCEHCVACISRCPVHSIQYGNNTVQRNRWVNPIFESERE